MWRLSGGRVWLSMVNFWCAEVKPTCGGAIGQSVGVGRSPQWHGLRAVVGSRGRGLRVLVWCVGTNGLGEHRSVRLAECVNSTRGAVGMCAGVRRIRRTWQSVGSADRTSKNVATAGSRGSRGNDRVCCWEGLRTLASMFAGAGGFRLAVGGSKNLDWHRGFVGTNGLRSGRRVTQQLAATIDKSAKLVSQGGWRGRS